MTSPKATLFLDIVSRLLPILAPALKIPPAYIPVIQDGIAAAEGTDFHGNDKLAHALAHVTAHQPKKADGTGTVPVQLGTLSDGINTIVDAANAASLIGSTINKF